MSSERETIIIQVNSGDTNAVGTPQSFRTNLPYPVVLDKTKEYEICAYDIQFQDRQRELVAVPPYLSVYVNTNLTDGNTIIGSQSTNVVLWVSWTHLYTDYIATPTIGGGTVFFTTEKNRKWYKLAPLSQIAFVDISLTLSTGVPIPFNAGDDFTSITLAIREILR